MRENGRINNDHEFNKNPKINRNEDVHLVHLLKGTHRVSNLQNEEWRRSGTTWEFLNKLKSHRLAKLYEQNLYSRAATPSFCFHTWQETE